jgi:putative FmdB family regulatory protein
MNKTTTDSGLTMEEELPIVRTYACEACNHFIEVTLSMEQCDDPAPECPACAARAMQQQFRPVAITGSPSARAHALAEDIAAKDYHVANMGDARKEGDVPKVRYKDQSLASIPASSWSGVSQTTLEQAIASGRHTRLNFGSGLDVLQSNLKSGAEPDLIAASKRRAMKVW